MSDPSKIGQVVAEYRIVAEVGRGGYGAAYLAERNGIRVVLKECHESGSPSKHAQMREALKREADFLKGLRHRGLPRLLDFVPGQPPLLVIEFLEGTNLYDVIHERKQKPGWNEAESHLRDVLDWARQTAAVLHYLHTLKPLPIVHRDLKTDNLILRKNGQIGLIDFGIARYFNSEKFARDEKDTSSLDGRGLLGTKGYVAPEYFGSHKSSPVSDLYSFGVILYVCLSGNEPDQGEKAMPIQDFPPLPKKGHALWDGLAAIALKAVMKEPSKRWQSAAVMAAELAQLGDDPDQDAREAEKLCQVCNKMVRRGMRFCPTCGAVTGESPPGAEAVRVQVEVSPLHQQAVADIMRALELGEPARLPVFEIFQGLRELHKDPGFGELISLPYLPRVTRLPHQIQAVKTALGPMRGYCLLADEVGLGKTIEAGIILKELMLRNQAQRILVVASSDGMCQQWQAELFEKFDTFFPIFGRDLGYSLAWKCDRLITQYRIVDDRVHLSALLAKRWDLVILDEAHHLIANDPRRGYHLRDFARRLGGLTTYFLMLSATPLHNNLRELHTLLSLLKPGSVGDYEEFEQKYVDPDNPFQPRNVVELRAKLHSVMVRNTRRRIQQLKFPRRVAYSIPVTVPPADQKLFREFRDFVRKELWGVTDARASVDAHRGDGELTLGFREAVQELVESYHSSPAAFERHCGAFAERFDARRKGRKGSELRDRLLDFKRRMPRDFLRKKVDKVREILRLFVGRGKFLVFTQYPDTAEKLYEELAGHGDLSVVLYPTREQDDGGDEAIAVLEKFDTEAQAMVCSENAAEGLNLQFANSMINFDLPWDPMRLEQRIGRIQRLGQKSDHIYIYTLFVEGSVEQDILNILDKKVHLFQATVGQVEEILGELANERSLENQILDLFVADQSRPGESAALHQRLDADLTSAKREKKSARRVLAFMDGEEDTSTLTASEPLQPSSADLRVHPPDLFIHLGDPAPSGREAAFCEQCGSAIGIDDRFCESCGAAVLAPDLESQGPPDEPDELDDADAPDHESGLDVALIPVALCPRCQVVLPLGETSCPVCHEQVDMPMAPQDPLPLEDETEPEEWPSFESEREGLICVHCRGSLTSNDQFCGECGAEVRG